MLMIFFLLFVTVIEMDSETGNNICDSPKWVTFHDAMDDAMEGGKLFPIKRRMSMGTIPYISTSVTSVTSVSSSVSSGDQNPLDFSQSFGFGDEIKHRNQPEKLFEHFGSLHFEREPNRKISAESNASSGSFSNDDNDKYAAFTR